MTTKRGDSGSAGSLGEKRVIIEAPNLVTKNDQNMITTIKITKNDQKSTKSKIIKIKKIKKTQNQQNMKIKIHQNAKNEKVKNIKK